MNLQKGKKLQINIFFREKNTKYKVIQPLCGRELQRFNKKVKLFTLKYFLMKNTINTRLFNHFVARSYKYLT